MSYSEERTHVPRERRYQIDELDRVTTNAPVTSDDGETIPSGSTGTVVAVWAEGKAFEVEFYRPFHALATVSIAAVECSERPDA